MIDPEVYGRLLAEARPAVIDSEEEHDRMLAVAESLMEKGIETLSPEEQRLLELVVYLIESFEQSIEEDDEYEEPQPASTRPHETLERLMKARELTIEDIAPLFGNPHIAREVLAGHRPISRNHAKELSRYFRMPAKLFQDR